MRQSGAEAIITLNSRNNIEKDRIEKPYRTKEIDTQLRIARTRKELKILQTLNRLKLAVPKVISNTNTIIEMEYIDGTQIKKLLDKEPRFAELIGKYLTIMHDNDIIHGDLTTSNMILKKVNGNVLYFIDFGLSFNSKRIEDKAVDIHLFKQALESKHFRVYDEALEYFMKGYNPKDKKDIMQRLMSVESRGRYKEKI